MTVWDYISITLLLFYTGLILFYTYGWFRISEFMPISKVNEQLNSFSILIPARNEEHVITKCLQDIVNQNYPSGRFEIIVINDHSTDRTAQLVQDFIHSHPDNDIRILNMHDDQERRILKKAAITFGVSEAKYEFVILTDADCERGKMWLETINSFQVQSGSKMVYAPVEFMATSVFEKIQALEFAALVGIGASAIRLKNPNMCSAANLIFERTVFKEVEGYKGYDGFATGDDEFLMHKVFKMYPDGVNFLRNRDAIVYTSANASLAQLTDQRRRWVSKSTAYEDRYITAILAGAYLFNLSVLINLVMMNLVGVYQFLIKMCIEFIFMLSVLKFFKQSRYLVLLPLAEIFHILYVIIIGIWANVGHYQWKGRKVN